MKPDEILLLKTLYKERPKPTDANTPFVDAMGHRLGMHTKRTLYILEKWFDKGWWMCGVSLRTGWFTELGLEEAKKYASCG